MASPNKQKIKTGTRSGVSAGTSKMLETLAVSSFIKSGSTIHGQGGSPWDKIFSDLGTKKRQHAKEVSQEFGQIMKDHPSLKFSNEKMPYAIMNVASGWAEKMSERYEKNASIAASLKDNTSSPAYKKAIKNMNSINTAFMNLDADLTGFMKYREEGSKVPFESYGNQYAPEQVAIWTAFMNPESFGKDGVFDDNFTIDNNGRVSYSLAYQDGGVTMYRDSELLSSLKPLEQVNQTQGGLGYVNQIDNHFSTSPEYSKSKWSTRNNNGVSFDDHKFWSVDFTPEMAINNFASQASSSELQKMIFNHSYSGILRDNDGEIRVMDFSSINTVTKYAPYGGSGAYDTLEECNTAHGGGCQAYNVESEGDKVQHYGGPETLVVDKYIQAAHRINHGTSSSYVGGFHNLWGALNPDQPVPNWTTTEKDEYIRTKMQEGHYIDVDGNYTQDISQSAVMDFYKKDYASYLWYKRASNHDNINTAGTSGTNAIEDISKYLDGGKKE